MKKALIVEDNKSIAILLKHMLRKSGFEAKIAEDGQEAFRMASTGEFDLITMDLMMPNWDGQTAINALGMIEYPSSILIISALHDDELKEELTSLPNVIGWLTKPFSDTDLAGIVGDMTANDGE